MIRITLLLIFTVALGCACGPKLPPDTSVEARLAVRATQVVQGLRATLPALKQMVCTASRPQPCLSPQDALKILDQMDKANAVAEQLVTILTVVDSTTLADDKVSGMAKARTLMDTIQQALMAVSITPGQEAVRQELVQIFSGISTLLFAIQ